MWTPGQMDWHPDKDSLAMQRALLDKAAHDDTVVDAILAVGVLIVFLVSMALVILSLSI
jgi:hypothetical protein